MVSGEFEFQSELRIGIAVERGSWCVDLPAPTQGHHGYSGTVYLSQRAMFYCLTGLFVIAHIL